MNKSKRKITALLIAASMAVGGLSYAVDGHAKKALAAEINVNVDKKNQARVSSGSVIDNPDLDSISLSVKQSGDKNIDLKWDAYEDAAYYTVFYAKDNSTEYESKDVSETQTNMQVNRGTKYTFCVAAFDKDGQPMAKTSKLSVCIPEKNSIRFTRLSSKKVKLNWSKAVGADRYVVYRKINNGKYSVLSKTDKLSFVDKSVAKGKKYKYYVKAVSTSPENTYTTSSDAGNFRIADFVNTRHQKYSFNEMSKDIKLLKNSYSNYVNVKVIGKSNDKRNIYDVIIGNPNAKKTMVVISNIHAREYMTAQLCMAQIEHYLKNYNGKVSGVNVKGVLNKMAIHYIPMANPDGVTISQFGISKIRDKKLRKALYKMPGASHTSTWKANARGVDLNRNSNSHFRANYGGKRGSEGFSGPSAASEPETKAISKLLKELKKTKTLKGVVNYHAMGSIVFGSGGKGNVKKNTLKMYRLARSITGYTSGDSYGSGSPSVGSMRDYIMEKIKSPSITLEIGVIGCPLPTSQFASIWGKNHALVLREAKLLL